MPRTTLRRRHRAFLVGSAWVLVLGTAGCDGVIVPGGEQPTDGAAATTPTQSRDGGATPRDDAEPAPTDALPTAPGDAAPVEDPPRPPGMGVMHTTAQLDFMRAHRNQEPWQSAYAQLINDAENALGLTPNPMADFDVPGGYSDPEGQTAAKERLRQDAFAAYALALGYQLADTAAKRREYAAKAVEFLDAWGSVNTQVSGDDGDLVLMYAGMTLIYAADLVMNFEGWQQANRSKFTYWVSTVFWNSAHDIKSRANNWGAWGTLGAVASSALLGNFPTLAEETDNLRDRIRDSIDENGELPDENKRTNSGMWYTYFALTSMTATAHIIRNVTGVDLFAYTASNGRTIKLALDQDFYYAIYPEEWPYPLPDGIEGELWRAIYPCADEIEMPSVTGWPGGLFEIMSDVYQMPEWKDWVASNRPLKNYHAWIYVTLMRQSP